ncbi:MAG: hypothetical protein HZB91_07485, partial [Elusimicrobia bacterium]|nr:hypothetical protein [Elusimicrobiota bacterium]
MGKDNPAGWRGDSSLWSDMVSFSDHWRSRSDRGLVGIDVRDAELLTSIDLEGMRVSLVVGPFSAVDIALEKNAVMPMLGLINLSGMLAAHGARVATCDFMADPAFSVAERAVLSDLPRLRARAEGMADALIDELIERCVRRVLADVPAIIGLSANSPEELLRWLLFRRRLRLVRPDIRVAMGGRCSFASLPDAAAREFDFLVVGEGEVPLLLICSSVAKGWDPARIPGLYHPDRPAATRCYPLSHNLDMLPPP